MIGWLTDNPLSNTVLSSIKGIELKHISQFNVTQPQPSVFYGILRGTGRAMHILRYLGVPFYYIDNGYFDATYIDKHKIKRMDGAYRVVKNDMTDVYTGSMKPATTPIKNVLVISPSPYSANFYDTTPEDWRMSMQKYLSQNGMVGTFRDKNTYIHLETQINDNDAVLAFNSMSIMKAIEMNKPVADTHGILRSLSFGLYDYNDVKKFYSDRQVTLENLTLEFLWSLKYT